MMRTIKPPIITRSQLVTELKELGIEAGQTVMLHASVKAIGWIVGGPDMVIQSLLDVLESPGTLMMLVSWEGSPYDLARWSKGCQKAYLEECPAFDPVRSRAYRKWSILTEYLRTWPGAFRSQHPDASFAAVGALARWITENHPLQYGFGPGSPVAKLCDVKGKVLLLGAPLDSLTILHHAEHLAKVPNKQVVHYKMPVLQDGKRVWMDIEEFDTCGGILPGAAEYFNAIPQEYTSLGRCRTGRVGTAESYLFDAADLVKFAVQWLEKKYGVKAEIDTT
jgi:aminoglycoside 3-N-acetyltransferase